jgi:hypothetical protein
MLQGVNRGSANSTGWSSIIGSFVIIKLPNNVRVMEKIVRCDDATNEYGRGKYRNVCRKYPKDKLHSEDDLSDRRTQTKYTVEK